MSSSTVRIAAVATNRPWRNRLQAHVLDHLTDVELVVIRDPEILPSLELEAIIVDDSVALFDDHGLSKLAKSSHTLIGIFDPEETVGRGEAALEKLGIEHRWPDNLEPSELIQHVLGTPKPEGSVGSAARAKPKSELDENLFNPVGNTRLVAVGGPDTDVNVEVACGLADAAAAKSLPLLVDLNEVDPNIAARLGLKLDPNVLDAIERISSTGDFSQSLGQKLPGTNSHRFDTLCGLANRDDWARLNPNGVEQVLAHALAIWDRVIACVGSRLDRAGNRHDVSRSAVSVADEIVLAMRPNPLGLIRGLGWLVEARRIRSDIGANIVFYGKPSKYRQQELINVILGRVPESAIGIIEFLPVGGSTEKALWQGQTIGGAFHRKMRRLEIELELSSDPLESASLKAGASRSESKSWKAKASSEPKAVKS